MIALAPSSKRVILLLLLAMAGAMAMFFAANAVNTQAREASNGNHVLCRSSYICDRIVHYSNFTTKTD